MQPYNMRCLTCGEYIYKGKKFNASQETVRNETYLGAPAFIHSFIPFPPYQFCAHAAQGSASSASTSAARAAPRRSASRPTPRTPTTRPSKVWWKDLPHCIVCCNCAVLTVPGATRNFEVWRQADSTDDSKEVEEDNPMKACCHLTPHQPMSFGTARRGSGLTARRRHWRSGRRSRSRRWTF